MHPVHPARDRAGRGRSGAARRRAARREQRAHDLHRQRGDVVVRPPPSSPATVDAGDRARRARRSPSTASPSRTSTPSDRRWASQGAIHASLVGASSTRSARPPARERSSSSCTRISPPVRALISRRPRGHERPRRGRRPGTSGTPPSASRLHVVPPALAVPLPDAPLVAARQQREQPLEQPRDVDARGRRAPSRPRTRSGRARARSASVSGACAGRDQLVRAVRPREQDPLGADQARRAPTRRPTGSGAIVSGRCR